MDAAVQNWMVAHRQPWLDTVMRVGTEAGSLRLGVVVLVLAAAVHGRRAATLAPTFVVGLLLAEWLVRLAKLQIGRARPPVADALITVTSPAMPSGHAANAAFVAVVCTVALAARWPRWRLLLPFGVLWAGGVALTRVYLGVHWLSDVLAGLAMGATLATPVALLARRRLGSDPGRVPQLRRAQDDRAELA